MQGTFGPGSRKAKGLAHIVILMVQWVQENCPDKRKCRYSSDAVHKPNDGVRLSFPEAAVCGFCYV